MVFRFLNLLMCGLILFCIFAEFIIYQFVIHQAPDISHIPDITINILNDVGVLLFGLLCFFSLGKLLNNKIIISLYSIYVSIILLLLFAHVIFIMKTGTLLDISLIAYTINNFSDTFLVLLGSLRNKDLWIVLYVFFMAILLFFAAKVRRQYSFAKKRIYFSSLFFLIIVSCGNFYNKEHVFYRGLLITPFVYFVPFRNMDDEQDDHVITDLVYYKNQQLVKSPPYTIVFIIVESLRNDLFSPDSGVIPFLSSLKEK